jgi:hypothetical protein
MKSWIVGQAAAGRVLVPRCLRHLPSCTCIKSYAACTGLISSPYLAPDTLRHDSTTNIAKNTDADCIVLVSSAALRVGVVNT